MSHQEGLSQWQHLLSSRLTHLSQPQLRILATWSFALVLSQRMGITWNSYALTLFFGGRPGTWRQSLREWCYDAGDKKGEHRRELDASACFAPLLAWVLDWWTPTQQKRLVLALDGTTLGNRFHILTVSVLYRGRAIPVAWQVRGARQRGAWEPIWERSCSPACTRWCLLTGWCSAIGGSREPPCFVILSPWAGIPFCGSRNEVGGRCRGNRPMSRCPRFSLSKGSAGVQR